MLFGEREREREREKNKVIEGVTSKGTCEVLGEYRIP